MYLKRKTPFGMFFNIFRAGGGYAAVALLVTCVARLEVMIVGFYAEAVGWTVLSNRHLSSLQRRSLTPVLGEQVIQSTLPGGMLVPFVSIATSKPAS